jgi:hypothetical protein
MVDAPGYILPYFFYFYSKLIFFNFWRQIVPHDRDIFTTIYKVARFMTRARMVDAPG